MQQGGGACCANAWRARHFVGGIAADRDKVGYLPRIDAIPLPHFIGTDTRHLAGTDGIENRGAIRRKLESVAVAARDEHGAAALFFLGGGGGEKIIGLEAGRTRILKTAGGHKLRNGIELFEQGVVELATALVGRKGLVPVSRDIERIPGDKHGARLLFAVEAQQHVGKAEDGSGRSSPLPQYRFRQGVVGAMREGIAIDHQQRPADSRAFTRRGSFLDRPLFPVRASSG